MNKVPVLTQNCTGVISSKYDFEGIKIHRRDLRQWYFLLSHGIHFMGIEGVPFLSFPEYQRIMDSIMKLVSVHNAHEVFILSTPHDVPSSKLVSHG